MQLINVAYYLIMRLLFLFLDFMLFKLIRVLPLTVSCSSIKDLCQESNLLALFGHLKDIRYGSSFILLYLQCD